MVMKKIEGTKETIMNHLRAFIWLICLFVAGCDFGKDSEPTYQEMWDAPGCCVDIATIASNVDVRTIPSIKTGDKFRLFLDHRLPVAGVKNMPAYYKAYRLETNNKNKIRVTLKSGIMPQKDFDIFVDSLLYATDQNGKMLELKLLSSEFKNADPSEVLFASIAPLQMTKEFLVTPRDDTTYFILYITSDNTGKGEPGSDIVQGVIVTDDQRANPYQWGWINILVEELTDDGLN